MSRYENEFVAGLLGLLLDDAGENHAHEMGKDALTEADWYDNLLKKLEPVDPDHSE